MDQLDALVKQKVLRYRANSGKGEYLLERPLTINIGKDIIDSLKAIYKPDYENGGLLEFQYGGIARIDCVAFHQVPNLNVNSTSYNPSAAKFKGKIQEILNRGNIPIAIHTHPTHIGWSPYDNKRVKFYLKSSKPDRDIANLGATDFLDVPEAIFVKDERFGTGYGIAFYEGQVFPYSVTALSTPQIWAGLIVGVLMLRGKLTRSVLIACVLWFCVEFFRRPKYDYENHGVQIFLSR